MIGVNKYDHHPKLEACMERSWIPVTIMCSAALGIILFSVVAGGYTSLWRAQNRIDTMKNHLLDSCEEQARAAGELAAGAGASGTDLAGRIAECQAALSRIRKADARLTREQTLVLEQMMAGIKRDIDTLTAGQEGAIDKDLSGRFAKTQRTLVTLAGQYNDEASYFNQRKAVFPGFIIAGWFNFDKIHYREIDLSLFQPAR